MQIDYIHSYVFTDTTYSCIVIKILTVAEVRNEITVSYFEGIVVENLVSIIHIL